MDNVSTPKTRNYTYIFPFERNFDHQAAFLWVYHNKHKSFYYAAAYLIIIFCGQAYMKNKSPVSVRWALFIWNVLLGLMSTAGALRTIPDMLHVLVNYGFRESVCSIKFYEESPVVGFWTYVFVHSKLYELLDTVFIVLRKQKLIFLHWFHHCTVLVYSSYIAGDKVAMGRWFMTMNFTVHAFMYTYFAVRCLKIYLPRYVSMFITTLQILQMLTSFYVSLKVYSVWSTEESCHVTERMAKMSILVFTFYVILFLTFFVETYIIPRNIKSE